MTDTSKTEIVFILDASGSMYSLRADAIGGFNSLIEEQKKLPDSATFTFVTFNNSYNIVHDGINLNDVPELTTKSYSPEGSTSLYDTIAAIMEHVISKQDAMREKDKPARTFMVIMTDGEENTSRSHNKSDIAEMIGDAKNNKSWEVLYMGANQDAFLEGSKMGIDHDMSVTYKGGSGSALRSASMGTSFALTSYRSTGEVDQSFRDFIETDGTTGNSIGNMPKDTDNTTGK